MSQKINLQQLFEIVKNKVETKETGSYCNEIAAQGLEKITRKIGEEATEVIIAAFLNEKTATDATRQDLVDEVCDLLFHNLILLAQQGISFDEILTELDNRSKKHD